MAARILVVEDNPANLELVHYLLEKAGHTVLTAEDGGQGLEIARREGPGEISEIRRLFHRPLGGRGRTQREARRAAGLELEPRVDGDRTEDGLRVDLNEHRIRELRSRAERVRQGRGRTPDLIGGR